MANTEIETGDNIPLAGPRQASNILNKIVDHSVREVTHNETRNSFCTFGHDFE
jgi:hypothetical protein